MDQKVLTQAVRKLAAFFGGVILAPVVLVISAMVGGWISLKLNAGIQWMIMLPVISLAAAVFVLRRFLPVVFGMIVCVVMTTGWLWFIANKASYENRTWEARRLPNRVYLYSNPPKAQFTQVDTNMNFVEVAGYHDLYYKRTGKVVATHKDFPGVQLFVDMKMDTYEVRFDFSTKKVWDLRPPFLSKFIH